MSHNIYFSHVKTLQKADAGKACACLDWQPSYLPSQNGVRLLQGFNTPAPRGGESDARNTVLSPNKRKGAEKGIRYKKGPGLQSKSEPF